jgi:CBS domain-containing protein
MLRLRDIMTTELVTVSPELSVRDTMELLVTSHVSGAPVVANHRVVGVVSATDLLTFAATAPALPDEGRLDAALEELAPDNARGEDYEPALNWFVDMRVDEEFNVAERMDEMGARRAALDRFADHTVSEVMNDSICWLPSSTRVDEAADFMRTSGIHRVLVMDDGVLVGIVSMKDIADAVADHRLTERTYVFGATPRIDRRSASRRLR